MGVVKDEHKESVHMDEVRRLSELSSGFKSKYNDLVDVYFYELDTNFSVYVWYLLVAGLICVALDTFFLMRGNAQNEPVVFWVGVVFINAFVCFRMARKREREERRLKAELVVSRLIKLDIAEMFIDFRDKITGILGLRLSELVSYFIASPLAIWVATEFILFFFSDVVMKSAVVSSLFNIDWFHTLSVLFALGVLPTGLVLAHHKKCRDLDGWILKCHLLWHEVTRLVPQRKEQGGFESFAEPFDSLAKRASDDN